MNFTVDEIRNQFPILERSVNDKPLVYFDNAATTQKPIEVIDEIKRYYEEQNANIHRGVHHLSQISTVSYENVRKRVAQFINASSERETIFTRGTTESINLVASSFGKKWLRPGDEIILTTMEHHSNIVPWQLNANGAKILVIPVTAKGELDISVLNKLISKRTKS